MGQAKRREQHRRYSDRRVAVLLALHEILFFDAPGDSQKIKLLKEILHDYETDIVTIAEANWDKDHFSFVVKASYGKEINLKKNTQISGIGLDVLIEIHKIAHDGAITLSRFRKLSAFSKDQWNSLWNEELNSKFSALLSVPFQVNDSRMSFLWLAMGDSSREWSSHDRELAEEIAKLFSKAKEKKLI